MAKKTSVLQTLAAIPKMQTVDTSPGVVDARIQSTQAPRTGPAQLHGFMVKESEALKDIEVLKRQLEDLKASQVSLNDLIEVDSRRRVLSSQEFDELKENIKINSLTTPITIRPVSGNKFEIVSGHNRVAVFRELGLTKIPAFVRDYTPDDAERGAFYANLMQNTLPDFEKYLGFKKIMAMTGKNQSEVAEEAGISAPTISRVMAFDELSHDLKLKIATKPSSVTALFAQSLLGVPNPMKALNALLEEGLSAKDAIQAGMTPKEPSNPKERAKPILIRVGQTRVAELMNRSGAVTIKFKDPELAKSLMAEFEALIKSRC